MHEKTLAVQILNYLGGVSNIAGLENCMTRLRVSILDETKADRKALAKLSGVISVYGSGNEMQIVLGPGVASSVMEEMKSIKGLHYSEMDMSGALMQKKKATGIFAFLSQVFAPLIPVLAGTGLLFGLRQLFNVCYSTWGWEVFNNAAVSDGGSIFMAVVSVCCSTFFTYMNLAVAAQAAKVMGGNPYLGLVAGGIITNVGNLAGYTMSLLGVAVTFTNGRGGTLAALAAGALIAVIEKKVRKHCPDTLKIHIPSLVSVLVTGMLILFVLQPVFGFVMELITGALMWLFNNAGVLGGAVIAFAFLPLVMTGMHHALTPIHLSMIESIGYTPLHPFCSMAGGGQVGAALALLLKYRSNRNLSNAVKGGIPAGILGIGEPLIFGVSLPLGRVFFTACAGAAIGGAFLGFFPEQGSVATYVSGILGTIVNTKPLVYFIAYLLSILFGFIFTYFVGAKKENLAAFKADFD